MEALNDQRSANVFSVFIWALHPLIIKKNDGFQQAGPSAIFLDSFTPA